MNLADHRQGLRTVQAQRRLLDLSFARLIAAAVADGYSPNDLLADDEPDAAQQGFDL